MRLEFRTMRRLLLPLAFSFAFVAWVRPTTNAQQPAAAPQPPKLAVLLVVDQMRADYLEISRPHWRAGGTAPWKR